MLAIELPEEIEQRLTVLARRTGRSETSVAREAIMEHLGDLEDIYLAEQELTAVRAGEVNVTSLSDTLKHYRMED